MAIRIKKVVAGHIAGGRFVKNPKAKITVEKTHLGPTGKPRYRVVKRSGGFIQGFPDLSKAEAQKIARELKRLEKNPTAFERCVKSVSARGGAVSPRGVCAAAGRKKYGKKRFQAMAAAGRKRKAKKTKGKR